MPIINKLFQKYKNTEYFLETGSHVGEGIQQAIDAGFINIISIELAPHYYQHCVNLFYNKPFVHLHQGDSEDLLEGLISPISETITFWLDGHYSGDSTAMGKHECPLMQELEIIKNHPIKTHTIIIDDLRVWIKPHFNFDKEDILSFLMTINPNYEIAYEDGHIKDDIMIAYIKK